MPEITSIRTVLIQCEGCPAQLVLPEVPIPPLRPGYDLYQRNSEQWDELTTAITAQGWSVKTRSTGGRFPLCPACGQNHQAHEVKTLQRFEPQCLCPMCGHDDVAMHFCNGHSIACNIGLRNHLHRVCRRCNYNWASKTMEESNGGIALPQIA